MRLLMYNENCFMHSYFFLLQYMDFIEYFCMEIVCLSKTQRILNIPENNILYFKRLYFQYIKALEIIAIL